MLQRLFSDPIFNVHLPEEALDSISQILLQKGEEFNADNDVQYQEEEYDYQDYIDYSNYEDVETVGSFLSDLNPEFLASVSPALIVGYIEGASPSDLKEILNNSTLLRKLPVETIGELLRKLPRDLILQVINSRGVEDLFVEAFDNITAEEKVKIKEFQDSLAPIVVRNLDAEIIAALPLSLLKLHLNIESAVLELFRSSDKLLLLIKKYPSLLNEISFEFIVSILLKHPDVERKIDDDVILALLEARPNILLEFPISFLQNIARDRPALVANFSEETVSSLASRPEILFQLSDKELMDLVRYRPTVLQILLELPNKILIKLLETRPNLLEIIPLSAESNLDQVILTLLNERPNLVPQLPTNFLLKIAEDRPSLVGKFSQEIIQSLASRPEILFEISNEKLMNLIKHKPSILEILLHLPPNILVELMEERPSLLDIIPANAEDSLREVIERLVRRSPAILLRFPTNFLLDMARNRPRIVANFPQEVINSLAARHEILFLLTDEELTRLLQLKPSLLEMLLHLPQSVLVRLLERRPSLLHIIPPQAEPALEQTILQLLQARPDIVLHLPDSFLKDVAASRPWLVAKFPQETIESLGSRHSILLELSDSELRQLLSYRPGIMRILPDLPSSVLSKLFRERPNILDLIPVQAEPYLKHILTDNSFLLKVQPEVLAAMADHKMLQKFLNKFTIISLLRVHPDLVQHITGSVSHFMKYLEDPWFRMRIPCQTVSLMSENMKLIESLPREILETVVTSKRILSCIPSRNLERLVEQSQGLSKVSLYTLMKSATVLPREKYTLKLIKAIIVKQVRQSMLILCTNSPSYNFRPLRLPEICSVERAELDENLTTIRPETGLLP